MPQTTEINYNHRFQFFRFVPLTPFAFAPVAKAFMDSPYDNFSWSTGNVQNADFLNNTVTVKIESTVFF